MGGPATFRPDFPSQYHVQFGTHQRLTSPEDADKLGQVPAGAHSSQGGSPAHDATSPTLMTSDQVTGQEFLEFFGTEDARDELMKLCTDRSGVNMLMDTFVDLARKSRNKALRTTVVGSKRLDERKRSTRDSYRSRLNQAFRLFFEQRHAAGERGRVMELQYQGKSALLRWVYQATESTIKPPPSTGESFVVSMALDVRGSDAENGQPLPPDSFGLLDDLLDLTEKSGGDIRCERARGFAAVFVNDNGSSPTDKICQVIEHARQCREHARKFSSAPADEHQFCVRCVIDAEEGVLRPQSGDARRRFRGYPPCVDKTDALIQISDESENAYEERLRPDDILVTRRVFRRIRHRYYSELVQERPSLGSVYRIWSPACKWANVADASYPAIDKKIGELLDQDEQWFKTADESSARMVSHRAIRYLERQRPGTTILRWECHCSRKFDLLHPVVESFRDLLELNRRSCNRALPELIESWIDQKIVYPQQFRVAFVDKIKSLLLGDEKCGDFRDIVDALAVVLRNRPPEGSQLAVVVENLHQADELTQQLVAEIMRDPVKSQLMVISVCGGKSIPWRNAELEDGFDQAKHMGDLPKSNEVKSLLHKFQSDSNIRDLLRIAQVFGWDCPRAWLSHVWTKTTGGTPQDFTEALLPLLRAGILRYSGLMPGIDQSKRFRELKFTSVQAFDLIKQWVDEDFRGQVVKHCLDSIICHLENQAIGTLPRKPLVCNLISTAKIEHIQGHLSEFINLWLLIGRRAEMSGALTESRRRLDNAVRLLIASGKEAPEVRLADEKLTCEVIGLYVRVLAELEPRSEDEASVIEAGQISDRLADSTDLRLERFALSRALWSWHHHRGKLATAASIADCLQRDVDSFEIDRDDLRLEVDHLQALTSFSIGNLAQCREVAEEGKRLCEKTHRSRHFDDSPIFGGYDGAAVCKVIRAILLLLENDSYEEASKQVMAYADGTQDKATRLIARSYVALMYLLANRFNDVEVFRTERVEWDVRRWLTMADLVWCCAAIGRRWEEEAHWQLPFRGRHPKAFAEHVVGPLQARRREWARYSLEYEIIWATFEAIALAMLDDAEAAEALLREEIKKSESRGEVVYLPEAYRILAVILSRTNQSAAKESLQTGLQLAEAAGNKLFAQGCREQQLS